MTTQYRVSPGNVVPASAVRISRPAPTFPVLLFDQVVVKSGAEQAFRNDAFLNTLGRAMELRSLRVAISLDPTETNFARGGGVIALQMSIDDVPMTRGPVPVWSMCRSDNRTSETAYLVTGAGTIAQYIWIFSQPVPLRPGQSVRVTAHHLGVVTTAATVSVSFAGRISPSAIPNRIPYVTEWTSRSFAYTEAGIASTPPSALSNDCDQDFNVDRIIGRAVAYNNAYIPAQQTYAEMQDHDDVSGQDLNSFSLRLGLSQNRPILKTYTPWRTVFGSNATLEPGPFILRPGDFITADVKHVAGPVFTTAFTFSQNRGSLSLVGWREV